jgi:hypothetical protein
MRLYGKYKRNNYKTGILMLKRRLYFVHWTCFILVFVLTSLTIIHIIFITFTKQDIGEVSPEMIDKAALQIILYFLIMPIFTTIYWSIMRIWVFFPWQHKNVKD